MTTFAVRAHVRTVPTGRASQTHHGLQRHGHDPDPRLDDKDVVAEHRLELKHISFVMAEVIREDDRA